MDEIQLLIDDYKRRLATAEVMLDEPNSGSIIDTHRTARLHTMCSDFRSAISNLQHIDAELRADIRNKLTPVQNLVAMLENNVDRKFVDDEIVQVKESIKYLSK